MRRPEFRLPGVVAARARSVHRGPSAQIEALQAAIERLERRLGLVVRLTKVGRELAAIEKKAAQQ